jgi:hypothetical protein
MHVYLIPLINPAMKSHILISLTVSLLILSSVSLFSQSNSDMQEFGITTGTFSNFPATQDYLKKSLTVFYAAPYIRTGKHEFSLGLVYPLANPGLAFSDNKLDPRPGAIAGYKFYIFNVWGRENLFVHYAFQYLRFKGDVTVAQGSPEQTSSWIETDMYINNVVGLGYNIFFDTQGRFGFYYTLDYVVSQTSYKLGAQGYTSDAWATNFVWNNLSTNLGFIFRITSLKKKMKK